MYVNTSIIPHNLILKLIIPIMTADSGKVDFFTSRLLPGREKTVYHCYQKLCSVIFRLEYKQCGIPNYLRKLNNNML